MKASEMTNEMLAKELDGIVESSLFRSTNDLFREAAERLRNVTVRSDNSAVIAELERRLEAVVKIASDNSWCEDSGVVETNTCAKLHNSYMSDILHAARGEYDDDNHSSYTDDIYNS